MTISDNIRLLAREGVPVTEIARRLGIRYQFAYGVLKSAGILPMAARTRSEAPRRAAATSRTAKPALRVDVLVAGGFAFAANWHLSQDGDLIADRALPNRSGVYAFAIAGTACYVGVATMGLAKRLYFYGRPGSSQRANQRLNGMIRNALREVAVVEIYILRPRPTLNGTGFRSMAAPGWNKV